MPHVPFVLTRLVLAAVLLSALIYALTGAREEG